MTGNYQTMSGLVLHKLIELLVESSYSSRELDMGTVCLRLKSANDKWEEQWLESLCREVSNWTELNLW